LVIDGNIDLPRLDMAEKSQNPRVNWFMFVGLSLYLVFQAAWRFFTRAGEWPSSAVRTMEIGVDVLMCVAVAGLYFSFKDDPARRGFAAFLLIIMLVAAAVIFGIRFSSDVGWWTGHRLNWTD
jgi:cation transport ATPase